MLATLLALISLISWSWAHVTLPAGEPRPSYSALRKNTALSDGGCVALIRLYLIPIASGYVGSVVAQKEILFNHYISQALLLCAKPNSV